MIIQLRLAQFNIDAAEKELNATKSWAQDSLLAQLCEVFGKYSQADVRHGLILPKAAKVFKGLTISMRN